LQEIVDRDQQYYKPREIVGLTAYSEVRDEAARRFAEDLWMVIQYDVGSDSWAEQLRRKIEYIQLAQRSEPIPGFETFLGVVTALQDLELRALLDVPWNWTNHFLPSDASPYFKGTFKRRAVNCDVVAVSAPRMGLTAAAVTTMKLIGAFRPRFLAMVGITSGIRGRCQLGDIIAVDPGWDWGSGKLSARGSNVSFQPAPHQIGIDSFLLGKLGLFAQDGGALDAIRRSWKGPAVEHILRMHIGPVASGAAVLADKAVSQQIIEQHRKLLGVEMETYGVYAAAQESSLPQPKAFSLKSVSDFADSTKGDDFQKYAAFTSAQALKIFVEGYL
jgi:nucleoside phosphorylase